MRRIVKDLKRSMEIRGNESVWDGVFAAETYLSKKRYERLQHNMRFDKVWAILFGIMVLIGLGLILLHHGGMI